MKGTNADNTYGKLFEGSIENVIECIHVEQESCREEVFNTLQLSLKGNQTIQDSIRGYIAEELLEGDNKYQTDDHGKQDAKKYIRFKRLPPVLQISLNRFDFDLQTGSMAKFNQALNFEEVLDFESITFQQSKSQSKSQKDKNFSFTTTNEKKVINRYHLHSMLIHSGTLN